MTHTVIGLFDSRNEAQAAMQELVQQGFVKDTIDVSNRSTGGAANTGGTTNTANTTQSNEGVGDSISNFFSSLFGEDETVSRNYRDVASETEAILSIQVDSPERAKEAAKILDRNGAIDVDDRAERVRQNYSQSSGGATQNRNTQNQKGAQSETSIPVMEEKMQIGKQAKETGGVRVHSRIVEKPVEENLRLREEHVVVNRNRVDREATSEDMNSFREGDIEITEHSEVPVVSKQARVVEEITVGKTVEERNETVRDTVRSTEVDVEKIDGETDTRNARRAGK